MSVHFVNYVRRLSLVYLNLVVYRNALSAYFTFTDIEGNKNITAVKSFGTFIGFHHNEVGTYDFSSIYRFIIIIYIILALITFVTAFRVEFTSFPLKKLFFLHLYRVPFQLLNYPYYFCYICCFY